MLTQDIEGWKRQAEILRGKVSEVEKERDEWKAREAVLRAGREMRDDLIAALEKVVEAARALYEYSVGSRPFGQVEYTLWQALEDALDATSKDSGEPAERVTTGTSGAETAAEPAGSSSLSDDDARTVAMMVNAVVQSLELARGLGGDRDNAQNPATDLDAIIRSARGLLRRVRESR